MTPDFWYGIWFMIGWIGASIFAVLVQKAIHMRMKGCTRDQDCERHMGDCSL